MLALIRLCSYMGEMKSVCTVQSDLINVIANHQSTQQWCSQVTDDTQGLHAFVVFWLGAYFPSKFCILEVDCSWDYFWNAASLESEVVLTHDFGIHACSTVIKHQTCEQWGEESVGNCIIANSYTTKVRCSTVFWTLTPGSRPGWAWVWLRHCYTVLILLH